MALRAPHLGQHGFVDEPLLGQEDELCAPLHLLSRKSEKLLRRHNSRADQLISDLRSCTLARDLLGIAVTDRLGHLPSSGARRGSRLTVGDAADDRLGQAQSVDR